MKTSHKSTYKNRCKEDRSIFVGNTANTENNYLLLVNFHRAQDTDKEVAAAGEAKDTVLDVEWSFVGGHGDKTVPEDLSERPDTERVNVRVYSAILVNYLVSHQVRPTDCPVLPLYDLSIEKTRELPGNQSLEWSSCRLQPPVNILYPDCLPLQQWQLSKVVCPEENLGEKCQSRFLSNLCSHVPLYLIRWIIIPPNNDIFLIFFRHLATNPHKVKNFRH